MPRIDYHFSVLSPFSYLAGLRLEEIAERRGADIAYRPIDIMRVFEAVGAQPVPKRHPSRQEYRLQELRRLSRRSGLPLNLKPAHWPTDPTPASLALIAARKQGRGDLGRAVHALMRACWAEERDVSDPKVIADCLAEGGISGAPLSPGGAAEKAEYAADTEEAISRGVFGVPFYIVGDERFWGQDRLDHLDDHLAAL